MTDADARAECVRLLRAEHAAYLASDPARVLAAQWLAGLNAAVAHHSGEVFPLLVRAAFDAARPWIETTARRVRAAEKRQDNADDRLAELAARLDELKGIVDELTAVAEPPDWA
jgi:hypothetical protein